MRHPEKQNKRGRRVARVAVASALGLALLMGGSTYALWSATDTSTTGSTITTGDLKVTAASVQKWFDVTDSANPTEITDLSAYRLSPGRTLQLKQDLNVIALGDNISGILNVLVPNNTLSDPLMSQAQFTLTLLNKTGENMGTLTSALNTANSLTLNVPNLPPTVAAGELYTVELSVALPSSADNATTSQTANLGDMAITLTQGTKYVPKETTIVTKALVSGAPFQPYSMTVKSVGAGNATFTATGLPSGLAMSPPGVIAGTTSSTGDFPVKITATNGITTAKSTINLHIEGVSDYEELFNDGNYTQRGLTATGQVLYFDSPYSTRNGDFARFSNQHLSIYFPQIPYNDFFNAGANLSLTISGLQPNTKYDFGADATSTVASPSTRLVVGGKANDGSGHFSWQGTTNSIGQYSFTAQAGGGWTIATELLTLDNLRANIAP